MQTKQQVKEELTRINELLRDITFAASMAAAQEAAYYTSQQQLPPPLFEGDDSLLKKSVREEKIAINLAGLYAAECGACTLMAQKGETPVYWLQQMALANIDAGGQLLLARFANATWKTGQPFRSLLRIRRDNFIVAPFLNKEEIQKDMQQVTAAATLLLSALKNMATTSRETQLQQITSLLRDVGFAAEAAQHQEAAYYNGLGQQPPPFLSATESTATIEKSAREEKIAVNMAGFYAMECGVNYLVTAQGKPPSVILQSIVDDSINQPAKQLLERFANATWKASQPFRGLDRISRDIFMSFDLLPAPEIEKDWMQVKSAASILLKSL
jgi:hypothetical protein